MIAITGATGKLGRLVVNSLLTSVATEKIVLAVRSPEKATDFSNRGVQVRTADYHDPKDWPAALDGAEKLLLISTPDRQNRVQQHEAVVNAARTAGVKLIVFTSLLHADRSSLRIVKDFRETEELIRASGVPFTFLRNAWYTSNKTMLIGPALAQGIFPGAAQSGRYSAATHQDYAEAAAAVLTTDGHENRAYELAGDHGFTLPEFVAEASAAAGKPLTYQNVGEQAFAGLLMKFGIPKQNAEELAESEAAGDRGEHFEDSRDLGRLIGRPTTPWKETVAAAVKGLPAAR